jgi:predicted nucleic acid-binding protein
VINPDAVSDSERRDAADEPVLGTLLVAVRSRAAQALLSGNKDLLALRDRYAIVTPAEFWARHGGL